MELLKHVVCLICMAIFSPQVWALYVSTDSSFGTHGVVSLLSGDQTMIHAVAVQTDGKIVWAGASKLNNNGRFIIGRLTTAGVADAAFGSEGKVVTAIGSDASIDSLIVQADGTIIVAGYSIVDGSGRMTFARYTSTGMLDITFGDQGIMRISLEHSSICASKVQIDQKIVAVGQAVINGIATWAMVRLSTDGLLDQTFGTSGIVTTHMSSVASQASDVHIQQDGSLIVAGQAFINGQQRAVVAKYSALGVFDETFGIVTVSIQNSINDDLDALVVQNDGKIIVSGRAQINNKGVQFVARLTSLGVLDDTFGTHGVFYLSLGNECAAHEVILQDDGKIVVVGESDDTMIAARLTSWGILDASFGTSGTAIVQAGTVAIALSACLQADNKLVVAGYSDQNGIVARYYANNNPVIMITQPEDGSTIVANTFAMTGHSTRSGLDVRIKADDMIIGSAITAANGDWNAGISPVLAANSYSIKADLLEGQTVVADATHSITLNPPDIIQITAPESGITLNTNKPFISGKSSSGSQMVVLTLDTVYWASATTNAQGDWQVTLVAVDDGNHELVAALMVNGSVIASASRSFTTQQYACDHLRALGGTFTTGNPPLIVAGSGNSCPPTCDFAVSKVAANTFNVTFGYPFAYAPVIATTVEKVRSINDGFVTIEDSTTQNYVVFKLRGMAKEIHFGASSCRG